VVISDLSGKVLETNCSICIDETLKGAQVASRLRKELSFFYDLCTLELSGKIITRLTQMNICDIV
jgi:hypothetical protein